MNAMNRDVDELPFVWFRFWCRSLGRSLFFPHAFSVVYFYIVEHQIRAVSKFRNELQIDTR